MPLSWSSPRENVETGKGDGKSAYVKSGVSLISGWLSEAMRRAVIYARFSSELQDTRSIGDQVTLLCDYAQRKGYAIVRVYDDAAASGASIYGRPGLQQLLADTEKMGFDVLLIESMSRLGRDEEDRAAIRKRMKFFRVDIETPGDGVVSPLLDGVRAVIDSQYLEDLKRQTRRGMGARVKQGKAAGGLTYGYAPGAEKGTRIIVEHQAAIVRRIFAEYLAGASPRAIASRLNAEGVAPPRGGFDWQASAINGNAKRGQGILLNPLYDGRLVWNRISMVKDPRTGKRVSRPNPESEWIEKPVEDLRIVDHDTFMAVQRAKSERTRMAPEQSRRPRYLLSGLLRCGVCGGSMNRAGPAERSYVVCGRRRNGGKCDNAKSFPLADIDARVFAALRAQLADPRAIARYLETYLAERKRLAAGSASRRRQIEKAHAQAVREIDRVVAGIATGTLSEAEARTRLPAMRERRDAAAAELATIQPPPKLTLHPAAVQRYLDAVERLAATLGRRAAEGDQETMAAVRELVAEIAVHPGADGPRLAVSGRLARLTQGEVFPQGIVSPALVAGARYRRYERPRIAVFCFAA